MKVFFYLLFKHIIELMSVTLEKFNPIVIVRIVRSTDDNPGSCPNRPGQMGNRRRWQWPSQGRIHAGCNKTCLQQRLEEVPGNTSIFPQYHLSALSQHLQSSARCPSYLENILGTDRAVANPASYTIRTEQRSQHKLPCNWALHSFRGGDANVSHVRTKFRVSATSCTRKTAAP